MIARIQVLVRVTARLAVGPTPWHTHGHAMVRLTPGEVTGEECERHDSDPAHEITHLVVEVRRDTFDRAVNGVPALARSLFGLARDIARAFLDETTAGGEILAANELEFLDDQGGASR